MIAALQAMLMLPGSVRIGPPLPPQRHLQFPWRQRLSSLPKIQAKLLAKPQNHTKKRHAWGG